MDSDDELNNVCAKNCKKEIEDNHDALIRLTNETFGVEGWSHSIGGISMDVMDFDGDKFVVGVHSTVKVTLKGGGAFHEDIGYGICKGLKCKSLSISKARKSAVRDGLENALRQALLNIIGREYKMKREKSTDFEKYS